MDPRERSSPFAIFLLVALILIAAAVGGGIHYCSLPAWIGYLAGVNLATLVLYGYDKAVAGGTTLRVPEKVLHLLALLGGTPAAFAGQSLFRHKTAKVPFRRVFWVIVALQVVLIAAAGWWWVRSGHSLRL